MFLLDPKRNVLSLDLETRRVGTALGGVRHAAVGPDGALYAVDTGNTVIQLVRRTPVRFRSKLQGEPEAIYATSEGNVLAELAGDHPTLEVLGSDQQPRSIPITAGEIATSFLGDLVAVAADSAVVLYSSDPKRQPLSIPVAGHARAVMFSPSGHRLYVARDRSDVLVLDRFGHGVLAEIDLPGPARALRGDAYGQWLLVRPIAADSVWVIDVGLGKFVGGTATKWDDDLPSVAEPATLLIRRGRDVVALDLRAGGFPETGRATGGAADLWLPVSWHPDGESPLPTAADSAALAGPGDSTGRARPVYLQVSSSQNPEWARELAGRLRSAGLPASVLPPARRDEAHRVVIGPYAGREQAEEAGRKIGMPSFVVTAGDSLPR
ncbi:MAG: SPOR domain-containing protein [Gemmatimonadales bacterium]|nr:SPOR domain-containing protein [Gemmatimonadales bacterium]